MIQRAIQNKEDGKNKEADYHFWLGLTLSRSGQSGYWTQESKEKNNSQLLAEAEEITQLVQAAHKQAEEARSHFEVGETRKAQETQLAMLITLTNLLKIQS